MSFPILQWPGININIPTKGNSWEIKRDTRNFIFTFLVEMQSIVDVLINNKNH